MTPAEILKGREALQKQVEILELRPFRMQAELLADAPPGGVALELAIEHDVEVKVAEGGFALAWTFALRFKAPGAPQPFARFAYASVTRYAAAELPGPEVLASFADTNGFIHVWPYVRSWVQGACGQLQIAAAPVPIVRFRKELSAITRDGPA